MNKKILIPAVAAVLAASPLVAQEATPTIDLSNLGQNTFGNTIEDTAPQSEELYNESEINNEVSSTEVLENLTKKEGDLLSATLYAPLTEFNQFWEVMGLPSEYSLSTHAQPITDLQETFGLPPSPSYNLNKEDSPLTIPLINDLYNIKCNYNAIETLLNIESDSSDTLFNTYLGDVANKLFNIERQDQECSSVPSG